MRDCAGYNVLSVSASSLDFDNCRFDGNSGLWGFLSQTEGNVLHFSACSFGPWESAQVAALTAAVGELSFEQAFSFAEQEAGAAVKVSTPEEFFEAVRPGALIYLEPGRYDLGAWIAETWASQGESWNTHHPYVRLQECYDGVEAIITGADGLGIVGLGRDRGDTELVVEARYANVLTFQWAGGIALANLTLGHTEGGLCSGSVIALNDVSDITLTNLDLYGCGSFAVSSYASGSLTARGCTMRDCTYGPVSINSCWGGSSFEDCVFTGSAGGFEIWESTAPSFLRCVFGETEYSSIAYRDGVILTNCWHG